MPPYIRASNKQLKYIASMCDELGIANPTLYDKYSIERAGKLINRLRRKLDSHKLRSRQLKLL